MRVRQSFYVGMTLLRCWMPVATAWAMTMAIARDFHCGRPVWGAGCAAAGTLAVYSADRVGDPRVAPQVRGTLIGAMLIGTVVVVIGLIGASGRIWLTAGVIGALGFLHRWLRRWLPKNMVVGGAWAVALVSFAGVPRPSSALVLSIAVLIWSACLLCDLKDGPADSHDGTITEASLVGWHGMRWVALVGLVASGITALLQGWYVITATALAIVPLAFYPHLLSRPILGPVLVDGLLALPGLVVAAWELS